MTLTQYIQQNPQNAPKMTDQQMISKAPPVPISNNGGRPPEPNAVAKAVDSGLNKLFSNKEKIVFALVVVTVIFLLYKFLKK